MIRSRTALMSGQFFVLPQPFTLNDGLSASSNSMRRVVDRAANPLGVRAELVEPLEQVVVGVSAVFALGDRGVELGEPRVELQGRQCRWVADPIEEIPVVVEELGHPAQVLELAARAEQHEHRGLERGIVEEIVTGAAPARVEREQRRHLVVHLDARRQAGLDRERGENALRERVQRADRGGIELVERQHASRPEY